MTNFKGNDLGIELGKALGGTQAGADLLETFKGQLLIVLVQRLGGKVDVPVAEVDQKPLGTLLQMTIDPATQVFHLEVVEKKVGEA